MKTIDLQGITNMEPVRGGTEEWYWSTDYIHGDLYDAEELFHMGHLVRSNRLYLIHYGQFIVRPISGVTQTVWIFNLSRYAWSAGRRIFRVSTL